MTADQPPLPFGPVAGKTVVVSAFLVGAKTAVRSGDTLYVSPAMWDLLSHATSRDEFTFLMNNIMVTDLAPWQVCYYSPISVYRTSRPHT